MKYRDDLDPVLKGISFEILPGEKIGIVGRTGCGKSSMMNSLFRMVECSSGKIEIDGVDISKIGLKDLRSSMAIIPQDSYFFSGTVRSNLDPFEQHSDDEIWEILEEVRMKQSIQEMPDKLTTKIIERKSDRRIAAKKSQPKMGLFFFIALPSPLPHPMQTETS